MQKTNLPYVNVFSGSHPLQAHPAGEEGRLVSYLTVVLHYSLSHFGSAAPAGPVLRVSCQQTSWSSDDGFVAVSRSDSLNFYIKSGFCLLCVGVKL